MTHQTDDGPTFILDNKKRYTSNGWETDGQFPS